MTFHSVMSVISAVIDIGQAIPVLFSGLSVLSMLIHNQFLTIDFIIEVVGVIFSYKEAYHVAEEKGYNTKFWSGLNFLFSPVFVILYLLPTRKEETIMLVSCPTCCAQMASTAAKCLNCHTRNPQMQFFCGFPLLQYHEYVRFLNVVLQSGVLILFSARIYRYFFLHVF